MASSQVVEISSSSPFGCVLRDSNPRKAACRESSLNSTDHHHHRTFQRNIKNFVMDLKTCMAVSADSTPNENEINSSSENNNNNNLNQNKAPKNNNPERLRCFSRSNSFIHNTNNEISWASLISPRHSRLLDRWAAKHAREMVSNLENEAELLSMDDKGMLPRTSTSSSEDSELRNLGASSLVQMWEKRLNKSSVSKPNTPTERTSLASSPTTIENANAFFDGSTANEGHSFPSVFHDWECSDQSLSSKSSVSVADIIKKLTATNQNQSPTPSFADDNEHEGYGSSVTGSPCRERECGQQQQRSEQNQRVTCSPIIRGRQAYNNLLQQMGNDRNGELNKLAQRGAVSKFAQRGRIQALLRLKLLQREVAAKDPSRQKSAASEVNNQQSQGSYAIMQLRERFSSGAVLRTPVQTEADNPRGSQRETVNKTTQLNNSATTGELNKNTSNQKGHGPSNHAKESTLKSRSQTKIDHNTEEARSSSDVKALHNDSQETTEATTSMTDSNINEREETSNQQNEMAKSSNDETVNGEEASNQQYAETSHKETVEEEATNQNYAESCYDYDMEEEVEDIDRNCDETNYDWISEISRPRSYWEERRQAWYREMLENDSQNEDIRRLLERGTVSNFLSSDFRDRMDRLMESHRGTQTRLVNNQDREEDSQGLMAFLQERLQSARTPQVGRDARDEEVEERSNHDEEEEEEEEEEDNVDEHEHEEEHEVQSLISGSYHEAGTYSNRSSSWSYRDNEVGDDFDRVVSTSPQPYQSQPFYRDSPHCPATNHHSMELELIYDLRGQMEQLYHEISELRKSMKDCMDMQMELQKSMKQEVKTVKKEEKKPNNKGLKKGNCCMCYEMKVDSVLYRCGHMCACLKCANELQWNGGKCPICRAKIVDVVRVYVDG